MSAIHCGDAAREQLDNVRIRFEVQHGVDLSDSDTIMMLATYYLTAKGDNSPAPVQDKGEVGRTAVNWHTGDEEEDVWDD